MKLLARVFDRSIDVLFFSAAVIAVFIWGLISTEVITRFLANYSIIWAVEVSEFGLMAISFLGAAWLLKKDEHIKVDIVCSRLKPRNQVLLNIITSIIGIILCAFLVWYGTKVTLDHFQRHVISLSIMEFPTWPRYAVIALGCFLLLIQFWGRAYASLRLWRKSKDKDFVLPEQQWGHEQEA